MHTCMHHPCMCICTHTRLCMHEFFKYKYIDRSTYRYHRWFRCCTLCRMSDIQSLTDVPCSKHWDLDKNDAATKLAFKSNNAIFLAFRYVVGSNVCVL